MSLSGGRWYQFARLLTVSCVVQERALGFFVDNTTTNSVAGLKLVNDLKLETMPHPQPHMLLWNDCFLHIKT
jgi:hypothetical protein